MDFKSKSYDLQATKKTLSMCYLFLAILYTQLIICDKIIQQQIMHVTVVKKI